MAGESIDMKEIMKACSLAMKAHRSPGQSFLVEDSSGSSEVVFSFPVGSWSENNWFTKEPFGSKTAKGSVFSSYLKSVGNDEFAIMNEAFLRRFESILEKSEFRLKVEEAVNQGKKIVFTGHSLGCPIAVLATIWLLQESVQLKKVKEPICVTFGCPLIGNHILSHALRREKWSCYFINFVTRYDIVPRVLLAPLSSIQQQFNKILHFFKLKFASFGVEATYNSSCFKHFVTRYDIVPRLLLAPLSSIQEQFNKILRFFKLKSNPDGVQASEVATDDALAFYKSVMRNASILASQVSCELMGNTNLLLETVKNFIQLSPYRPFGTYIFLAGNGKLITLTNSNAILQLLFYSCQLKDENEHQDVASRSLSDHFVYEAELEKSLLKQEKVSLDSLKAIDEAGERIGTALNDLGVSAANRLCLLAAEEAEEKKQATKKKLDSKRPKMERLLRSIENYRAACEDRRVGYYDAFRRHEKQDDFKANVTRMELAGIWDDIKDMLKVYELPDEFEGQKDWIELGTWLRRVLEPLDISNYYRGLKNEVTGPYLGEEGRSFIPRPNRYSYTQRWLEHEERKPRGFFNESCLLAEVEELRINLHSLNQTEDQEKYGKFVTRAKEVQEQVEEWVKLKVIGKDVLFKESIFVEWWKSLPPQLKSQGIEKLVNGNA